ncbi:MAG: hypothetical protein JST48_04105 [Bacteroidetes bacterium]|nr:hypothetical protein [Bacteroidota bacterium]
MKALFTSVLAVCIISQNFATIRTVSNDSNNPAQYTDIPAAVAAASAGDTIYVNGTKYTYSDFTLNKKLIMIGAGYNSSNQFNLITQVNYVYLYKDAGVNNGSGSVITGFKVNGYISTTSGSLTISNVTIFRNMIANISASYPMNNLTVYNNIITGGFSGGNNCTNLLIQNNIFTANANIGNLNVSSVVIDHNLFIHGNAFYNLTYSTITNNIITSSDATQVINGTVTNCTFSNNLSLSIKISSYTPTNDFLANNNTGGQNIVGSDPLFTSMANFNAYTATDNYRLQTGSPGHNYATDGTDLGIYGGTYPFPSGGAPGSGYDTSAPPPIPQITSMNIQNASVLPGGQLKVNVKATVNN